MREEVECLVYENPPLMELTHHGVKGMHWGVRRYQNRKDTRSRSTPSSSKKDRIKSSIMTETNIRRGKIAAVGILASMGLLAYGEVSKAVINKKYGYNVDDQVNSSIRRAVIFTAAYTGGALGADIAKERKKRLHMT